MSPGRTLARPKNGAGRLVIPECALANASFPQSKSPRPERASNRGWDQEVFGLTKEPEQAAEPALFFGFELPAIWAMDRPTSENPRLQLGRRLASCWLLRRSELEIRVALQTPNIRRVAREHLPFQFDSLQRAGAGVKPQQLGYGFRR